MVCGFHARNFLNYDSERQWGDFLFNHGHIGVPIFFIISGFIMVYTTNIDSRDSIANVKDFLIKRIIRVVPLYYLFTFGWIVITHTASLYLLNIDGFSKLIHALLFLPTGDTPPLYVGWTLNYEMFFYFIFAISLFFKKKAYYFIYSVLLILVFIVPLFSVKSPETLFLHSSKHYFDSNYLILITNRILLFFLFGVLMGNTYSKIALNKQASVVVLLISLFLFTIYYFNIGSSFIYDIIFCGLLVFSIIHFDKAHSKIQFGKYLRYLGDISYSMYLIHPLIIIYLPGILKKMNLHFIVESKLLFVLFIITTIVSSSISYNLIEVQLTKYIKRKFNLSVSHPQILQRKNRNKTTVQSF